MAKANDSTGAVSSAFAEVSANPPKVLASTARKFGPQRAKKQKVAIALNKARRAGLKFPSAKMPSNKY